MGDAKNILIFFDGTSNTFGIHNTNVVRTVQVADGMGQEIYYDPGVGTLPERGLITPIGKKISLGLGLAFGRGLTRNVEQAYQFLMETWTPGAKVFMFGFSRGAYTARVLAGMLHLLGLLPRGNDDFVQYAARLFKSVPRSQDDEKKREYWQTCDAFRATFARESGEAEKRFPVHFLGLWDTVSSVGWAWEPVSFPFTAKNASVSIVRHAIAIDERRAFFRQNRVVAADGQDVVEVWFPGVHADVGGGYPESQGGLWRVAFEWMVREAHGKGMGLEGPLDGLFSGPEFAGAWKEPQHESLKGAWKIAEYFPKKRWRDGRERLHLNRFRPRTIREGELIHPAAIRRVQQTEYRPASFSEHFMEKIRAMGEVSDPLPYEPGAGTR